MCIMLKLLTVTSQNLGWSDSVRTGEGDRQANAGWVIFWNVCVYAGYPVHDWMLLFVVFAVFSVLSSLLSPFVLLFFVSFFSLFQLFPKVSTSCSFAIATAY